jgi:release factor glutamine methyltransferase
MSEAPFLHSHFSTSGPPLVLELGTGSGEISAFISQHSQHLFGRTDVQLLGTDANVLACAATATTLSRSRSHSGPQFLGVLTADLAGPLRANVVDVLVFNPPYVPTPELPSLAPAPAAAATKFDEESRLLALTYAGGKDGMQVTQRVLDDLDRILAPTGVAYILLCRSNRPRDVVDRLHARGWTCHKAGGSGSKGGIERLEVWRIWKH